MRIRAAPGATAPATTNAGPITTDNSTAVGSAGWARRLARAAANVSRGNPRAPASSTTRTAGNVERSARGIRTRRGPIARIIEAPSGSAPEVDLLESGAAERLVELGDVGHVVGVHPADDCATRVDPCLVPLRVADD